jgi:gliding motility-associated-like protein
MKSNFILFLIYSLSIFYFNSPLKSQSWVTLESGTNDFLLGVSAPSENTCYCSGKFGTLIKTTDGGCTWVNQVSESNQDLYSILFTDNNTGYAVGNAGAAMKTIDGGENWTAMAVGNDLYSFRHIFFVNSSIGFITSGLASNEGTIFKTVDAGANWYIVNEPTSWAIYSTYFTSENIGYFNAWGGDIYKTLDGGESWNYLNNMEALTTGVIRFTSDDTGLIVGLYGKIKGTNNGGANWITVNNGTSDYLTGLDFYDSNHGFAVGGIDGFATAKMLETNDGGYTWNDVTLDASIPSLFRIDFVDGTNVGYAVGCNGTILKYSSLPICSNLALGTRSISCFGANDGVAWIANNDGIPPYTYIWSPGGSTNDTIFNLSPGTYIVAVTDSTGTIVVDSVVVSQPDLLTVSIEAANDTICNGTNIYLNTYTNGGSAPYNYIWTTNSVDTLSSVNTYLNFSQFVEVSISDANNCTVADSIFITVQNPPLLVSSSDTCICLGNTATIIASGTPSYLWNTGDTTSVISVSPSTSTNYIVSYTDGICSVSDTTFVCVYPSISATVAIINSISCNGENDGAASVFVQGGIPPYSYLWLPGGSVNDSLFNLSTGIYTVSITDSSCNIVTDSITITEPNLLTVAVFAENDTVCLGNNIGLIATSNGGTLPYSYLWSTNIADTLSSVIADLNLSQFVEVSISDMNNCAAFDSIFITIQNPPLLVSTSDTCICFGDTALISASGVPSYFWNTGDSTATIIASPIVTTAFIVSYTDGICSVSDTTIVCVNPIPFVTASDDTSMAYNASVILNAFGDSPFYWSPSNSLSCNNCSSTIATPDISTTYTVAVTNAFGCSAQDTVNVEVYFYVITIPNIITPNNDAMNDVFEIVGLPQNSIISIFNRWGNELLNSNNYQNNWATTTDGVYYYILNTPDGKFYNGAFQVNGN